MKEKELRDMLGRGLVSLQFVKKNGETRNAVGTLNRWFIPRDKWPKGPQTSSTTNEAALALRRSGWVKDDYVRFYDFTVQDWRCLVCTEVLEAKPISLSLNPHPEQSSPIPADAPTRSLSRSLPPKGDGGCEIENDEPSDYNGMDYNDYKFEEALRKLESLPSGERLRVGDGTSGMDGGGLALNSEENA